jgi:mRNA interferase MazF
MVRGDVYWIKFKKPDKRRPALIITPQFRDSIVDFNNGRTNNFSDNASAVWLDESDGMPKPCVINVDHIQTVSKEKIDVYLTHIEPLKMEEVFEAIKFAFGFDK